MSKKTYLFKQSINRMLQLIIDLPEDQHIMANDIELTKLLSISRTTVRSCVEYLIEQGIVKRDGSNKVVLRHQNQLNFLILKIKFQPKMYKLKSTF
ncbi:hypothetical protein L3081_12000 [Colwellia sp. MSW7]|uniref:HTH gntR-type domain-containing protein n=1 Tax=Colwellia maritima TaxID=2912588 RepID=A0ABS9X1C8_9GAMM|nr:hypothetical protein [Colwellia maritima]MCI2283996.1 hypothetical protein [Colwellia maritima]